MLQGLEMDSYDNHDSSMFVEEKPHALQPYDPKREAELIAAL